MAVIDVFTFNGENSILKLHLGVLYDYVDKFIIVEANKTFTGYKKPMYFFREQFQFEKWHKKIEYYQITDWDDVELWDKALKSPNTQGASHWKREWYIKEQIQNVLISAKVHDDDTLFIGDVDEIINPLSEFESDTPVKAKLDVYNYYLNNHSNEQFWGTLVGQYKDIKGKCLNDMRSDKRLYSKGKPLGWHFTSMGGVEEVRRKLNDSYSTESYNTYEIQQKLPERIREGVDYLGRDFKFELDESNWPDYLTKHRNEFTKLLK